MIYAIEEGKNLPSPYQSDLREKFLPEPKFGSCFNPELKSKTLFIRIP